MGKNILLFVQEYRGCKGLFTDTLNKVFSKPSITCFSDTRRKGDLWSGNFLYNSAYDSNDSEFADISDDIIRRDRVLREMNRDLAYSIALRFWNGAKRLFAENAFDYFVTMSLDRYTIDILLRVAEKYDVPSISFWQTFLPGYARFSLRGEFIPLNRNVTNDEANKVFEQLKQNHYIPPSEKTNIKRKKIDIYKFYYRRKLIESCYYPLIRAFKGDKYNWRANILSLRNESFKDYYKKNFDSFFTPVSDLNIDRKLTVLFPLHFVPEATTDYWCDAVTPHIYYENYVIDKLENCNAKIKFLIKEHPAMYGKRKLDFYRKLQKYDNVSILHPLEVSNDLLSLVDTIVVNNGTVGIEAAIRGKRVIALNDNYYYHLHPNIIRTDKLTIDALNAPVQEYDNAEFVRALLNSMFFSDYRYTKKQYKSNPEQIADGIKLLIQSKGWNSNECK